MLLDLFVWICGLWLSVHAALAVLRRKRPRMFILRINNKRDTSLLPTDSSSLVSRESIAITHRAFSVRVSSTYFNNALATIQSHARVSALIRYWFSLGCVFGTVSLFASCIVVVLSCFRAVADLLVTASDPSVQLPNTSNQIFANTSSKSHLPGWWNISVSDYPSSSFRYSSGPNLENPTHGRFLVSLIPGVNLPLYALGYYFLALLIAGVFHEAGHAIAGASENVQILSVGVFLEVIYPGAFVELSDASMAITSAISRLRITCAGVWNNAVLGCLSWCILASLPFFLQAGYRDLRRTNAGEVAWIGGVTVLNVLQESPLADTLPRGTVVVGVDDFYIRDGVNDWENGLISSLTNSEFMRKGYCVNKLAVTESTASCCNVSIDYPLGNGTSSLQCFLPRNDVCLRPSIEITPENLLSSPKSCLELNAIVRHASECTVDSDCPQGEQSSYQCMSAYIPSPTIRIVRLQILDIVPHAQRLHNLAETPAATASQPTLALDAFSPYAPVKYRTMHEQVEQVNANQNVGIGRRKWKIPIKTVLYLGDPREISEAVRVGAFYPKYDILPIGFPYMMERLLHFLIAFNTALSILNMVPAYTMDGYHALSALLDVCIENSIESEGRMRSSVTLLVGHVGAAKLRQWKEKCLKAVGFICTVLLGALMVFATVAAVFQ
ncbi:Membrane-bound transcription factor site-2 protease [Chytriomyces hyalinus]|nr:Membrane-bound transcription factor site-2 protease [Chytriomyces hyalinus]